MGVLPERRTGMESSLIAQNAVERITKMEVVDEFEDDHIPSAKVNVETNDGNEYTFGLYWIGGMGVAHLHYFHDADRARRETAELFKNRLDCIIEADGWNEDDEDDVAFLNFCTINGPGQLAEIVVD
jgi:hypothetical protein